MIDWLKSCAIGAAKTGAPSRKNQAGIPSKPVAVALNGLNIWKTTISDIQSVSSAVVDFRNIIHQKHYPLFHCGSALDQKAAVWPQHRCAHNKATIPKNGMLLPYLATALT